MIGFYIRYYSVVITSTCEIITGDRLTLEGDLFVLYDRGNEVLAFNGPYTTNVIFNDELEIALY